MSFGSFFPFILCGVLFSLTLNILYFMKRHVSNEETKIFDCLLIINFIGLISELICSFLGYNLPVNCTAAHIVTKCYLFSLMLFMLYMTLYMFTICYVISSNTNIKYYKRLKTISFIVLFISLLVLIILPIETGRGFAIGLAVNFVFFMFTLILILWGISIIKNFKYINKKKLIPLLIFTLFLTIIAGIQKQYPEITLTTVMDFLIVFIMYHTIENPDMKILEEFIKNKKLTEDSMEEKSNMLFKVSQDVKDPVNQIENISNDIISGTRSKEIKVMAQNIKILSKDVNNVLNNVLNISDIDIKNIKFTDSVYNTYNLFNQIILLVNEKLKQDISFNYNVSSLIPEVLYGDSIKLKQIICSILTNCIDNYGCTNIDLDVSSIIRYNVCRLIITINGNGEVMPLEEINKILDSENKISEKELEEIKGLKMNLKLVKKMIDILGGSLLIKSDETIGNTFTIIINQKIESASNEGRINKIALSLSNKDKVLVVDDNYKELKLLSKQLKLNNFEVSSTLSVKDCLDKLNENMKFKYIFLDDEMKEMNAVEIINKIDTKKTKVIIMLNSDKKMIKDHYLKDYLFYDYLLKDDYKQEIKRILNK